MGRSVRIEYMNHAPVPAVIAASLAIRNCGEPGMNASNVAAKDTNEKYVVIIEAPVRLRTKLQIAGTPVATATITKLR
ncbi:hypothetical protein CQ018_11730 [Arthrobacter sp. MYb227]|nr:hypothetical protein CQ018_11730 [Arthrobacter sp. MYb227]